MSAANPLRLQIFASLRETLHALILQHMLFKLPVVKKIGNAEGSKKSHDDDYCEQQPMKVLIPGRIIGTVHNQCLPGKISCEQNENDLIKQ